jgi:hypothetical protein
MRELAEVSVARACVQLLEHLAHALVQPHPLRRREVPVQALAHQRVGEPEATERVGDVGYDARVDGFIERVEQLPGLASRHAREHRHVELVTDHRRVHEHRAAILRKASQASAHRVAQARGDLRTTTRRSVRRLFGGDHLRHLGDKQRVPAGVGVDRSDQPLARLPADRPRDHHRYRLFADAAQGHPNLRVGREIGDQLLLLRAAIVVSRERDDQNGPRGELARDKAQQQQRGLVGRVQVIEHEQQGALSGLPLEELRRRREHHEPVLGDLNLARAELGIEPAQRGQGGGERRQPGPEPTPECVVINAGEVRAQYLRPRPVRRRAARLPAAAPYD